MAAPRKGSALATLNAAALALDRASVHAAEIVEFTGLRALGESFVFFRLSRLQLVEPRHHTQFASEPIFGADWIATHWRCPPIGSISQSRRLTE
jgi:hypothetical protein